MTLTLVTTTPELGPLDLGAKGNWCHWFPKPPNRDYLIAGDVAFCGSVRQHPEPGGSPTPPAGTRVCPDCLRIGMRAGYTP